MKTWNLSKIKDLPEDCEIGFLFMASPKSYSCWYRFTLLKDSPLRRLFEAQEEFEEAYKYAKEKSET